MRNLLPIALCLLPARAWAQSPAPSANKCDGRRSIAIHYKTGNTEVIEVEAFAPDCRIERSNALYGPPRA